MQDLVIELLKSVNAIQLIAMGIIVWFFYSRLNEKADKNKGELKQEMDKNKGELKQEIEKLSIKVEDIDRRLCRIEGSLAIHGHCLFNQKQPDKKAE